MVTGNQLYNLTGTTTLPLSNTIGSTYAVTYSLQADQLDQYPYNNSLDNQVQVTEYILAKDDYSSTHAELTPNSANTINFTSIFDLTVPQNLYGFDVKFAQNTQNIGQGFYAELYDENGNVLANVDYPITAADLSTDIVTIPLTGGVLLEAGVYYLQVYNSAAIFAASGYCATSSAYANGGDYLTPTSALNATPIIRMNFNCQIGGNTPSFEITAVNNQTACENLCNGSVVISHNGSDLLRVFNSSNTLISTLQDLTFGSQTITGLCPGSYKVVGVKSCFNTVSDTLIVTINETYSSSIESTNTSTCIANDGSIEITLNASVFEIAQGQPYEYTFNWNGLTSGGSTVDGNHTNTNLFTTTIDGNFVTTSTTPYTLVVTDVLRNCEHTTTFSIGFDTPQQPTCLVTVDETTGNHNIVVWEKPSDLAHIDSFKIYREITTGNYGLLHTQSVDELSKYEDFTANPNATGYKYKISLVDVCGAESELSSFHNTIHLQYLGSGNFQWTQYAIESAANPVASYNVYRDDNGTGDFQLLPNGVVPGSQSTFTDVTYSNFPNAKYVVDVNWGSLTACNESKAFETSRSNVKGVDDVNTSGTLELSSKFISIFPNPSTGIFTIQVSEMLLGKVVHIKNTLGQVIAAVQLDSLEKTIDLSTFSSGIYLFELATTEGNILEKVVKK
jgi:phosphohistidine swiveling domain-containing protein